jgi:predicted lipoprotein with Yx(FWY)xxD motif
LLPAGFALSLVAALAACGGEATSTTAVGPATGADRAEQTTEAAEKPKPEPKPKPGTVIEVGESQFGDTVFDEDDQAIYVFTAETDDKPSCYGDCAAAWPPVLTKGEPEAGKGADQELLGTTERKDGSLQVTYRGQPLYYYANEGPNEVRCHNVVGFGGTWLAIGPDGKSLPT